MSGVRWRTGNGGRVARSGTWLAVAVVMGAVRASAQVPADTLAPLRSLSWAEEEMMDRAIALGPRVWALVPSVDFAPDALSNVTVIEQEDGFVLADAGKTRGDGERIVSLIRSIGPKPVKAVVFTHWHADHTLGISAIKEAWPSVEIITTAGTAETMATNNFYMALPTSPDATAERDSTRAAVLAGYAAQYAPSIRDTSISPEERRGWARLVGVLDLRARDEKGGYWIPPTRTFTERLVLDDPVAPVIALSVGPGHTTSDVVVWAPNQHVVATGDMVATPVPYSATEALEWPAALARIESLAPTWVVPGHGPVRNAEYVARLRAAVEEIREQVLPLVDGPERADEDVLAAVDVSGTREEFSRGNRWFAYWFDQYFVIPTSLAIYGQLRALRAP